VRGFSFNSLGVKCPNGKAKGGELSMSMNASIISPVTFMEDSKNMRVSAFIDAGDIPRREFKVYTNTRIFCNWNTVTNTPSFFVYFIFFNFKLSTFCFLSKDESS
jgi:outer membrane protein assembly factor BamA